MDCVFLNGLIVHIAKYKINYNDSYILAEDEEQLESIKKDLDGYEIAYIVEELDYKPYEWAKGLVIEDGDNLLTRAKEIVAEGEATYYAKKELTELDITINRSTEDLYIMTGSTPYSSVQAVIDRKNELREILKQEQQKNVK